MARDDDHEPGRRWSAWLLIGTALLVLAYAGAYSVVRARHAWDTYTFFDFDGHPSDRVLYHLFWPALELEKHLTGRGYGYREGNSPMAK